MTTTINHDKIKIAGNEWFITKSNMGRIKPLVFLIWAVFLLFFFTSCKTSYSINQEPFRPDGVVFGGTCLVNKIYCPHPIKKEEAYSKVVLNQLTKIEGAGIRYIGHIKPQDVVKSPINFVPQPDLMDSLFQFYNFQYIINISVDVNTYKNGGFGWTSGGTIDIDHAAFADITVYETKSNRRIYGQRIILDEHWDSGSGFDDPDDKSKNFQIKYSSESLMKKAVKKAARNLKANSNKAKKRMLTDSQ